VHIDTLDPHTAEELKEESLPDDQYPTEFCFIVSHTVAYAQLAVRVCCCLFAAQKFSNLFSNLSRIPLLSAYDSFWQPFERQDS
jgi:hypothetical protein